MLGGMSSENRTALTSLFGFCSEQWPFYGAAAILYESHLGDASALRVFLELLPTSVDTPRHWSPGELAAMQYTETVAAVSLKYKKHQQISR